MMMESTQDPSHPTPEIIASILLASWRMSGWMPEKVFPHLRYPQPPNDYGFLDAFATLCSFVPHCESAAAVIELGAESNRLYISTSPPIAQIPSLRKVIPTWIRLIQQLPHVVSSSSPADSESVAHHDPDPNRRGSPYETAPILEAQAQNFVADVYRTCHVKILDSVRLDDEGKELLETVSELSDQRLELLGFAVDQRPALLEALSVLIEMAEMDIAAASVEEILRLHRAARTVAKAKDCFCYADLLPIADRLSEAVDFIIAFATSKKTQPQVLKLLQDVDWVNVTSFRDVIATINPEELFQLVSDGRPEPSPKSSLEWLIRGPPLDLPDPRTLSQPPSNMSPVECLGSPGASGDHLKGVGVMHPESALIQHMLDSDLPVHPYIGTSHPACYACVMLVRACNHPSAQQRFALGRRDGVIDPAWVCPGGLDLRLYDRLVASVRTDFRFFCNNEVHGRERYRSLVNV